MILEELRARMMKARGVDPTNSHFWPYWTKLAQYAIEADEADIFGVEPMARALCAFDGNNPDKESVGIGSLIPRDQPYRLWEAWATLATVVTATLIELSAGNDEP